MLKKQQMVDGECQITTVLFDNDYELLHDRIDIRAVSPITKKEYQIGGSTALLDAMGRTIQKIDNAQKHTAEEYRAEKVMFVIITDGMENASREYTTKKVKSMIEAEKEKGWEFVFLGANMDAVETAAQYGIDADNTADYLADREGTRLNYTAMSDAVAQFRTCGCAPKESLKRIREDAARRGGKKRRAKK